MKVTQSLICSLIMGLLFFVLSPGILLTLPPSSGCSGVFMQLKDYKDECATSYAAAAVHAVVFALVVFAICYLYKPK